MGNLNGQVMQKTGYTAFPSEFVAPRRVDVYLPPDYPAKAPYRVLYMHDGQNLSDPATSMRSMPWKADSSLMHLMQEGEIPPCILVGIWNTSARYQEYAPQPAFTGASDSLKQKINEHYGEMPYSDRYLRFITEELKPFIDREYQTDASSKSTAIAGSSMGGLISLYALCKYPGVFGSAACLSIHWPILTKVNDKSMFHSFSRWLEENLPNDGEHLIYLDQGTETLDSLYAPYMNEIRQLFIRVAFPTDCYSIRVFEGAAHEESAWAERFAEVLRYLYRN